MATKILEVSADLFAKKGYASTTTKDIGDAVGLLKGSLYYYFDTKEELLFKIIENRWLHLVAMIEDVRAQDHLTPLDRLRYYMERHIAQNARNVAVLKVYSRDLGGLSPKHRRIVEKQRMELDRLVEDLVTEAQAAGEIDRRHDPRLLRFWIFGAVNYLHVWYDTAGPVNPDDLATKFAALTIAGLSTPPTAAG